MAITIGSNIASLMAQRQLGKATDSLSSVSERLASGQRINHASDDAVGLSVASALNNDARVFTQAIRNTSDGISFLNIAEGALTALKDIVIRQAELAEQAANGVYSLKQRTALDAEAGALSQEFTRIVKTSKFNGRQVLGSLEGELRIQFGYGLENSLGMNVGNEFRQIIGDEVMTQQSVAAMGYNAAGVASADINGDGNVDLVFAGNNVTNSMRVLLGNGDNTFSIAGTYATGTHTVSGTVRTPIIADFNNDGKLDVVTGDSAGQSISVLFGNGTGSFNAAVTYVTGSAQGAPVYGDFNGDGFLDIHGSNRTLINDGAGGFSQVANAYSGARAVTDINGDGRDDLVINVSATDFGVAISNGNGTFARSGTYSRGMSAGALESELHDVNGDGTLDFIIAGYGSATGTTFSVALGNSDGSFSAGVSIETALGSAVMSAADINNDGRTDIVMAGNTTGTIAIHYGNGDGTFTRTDKTVTSDSIYGTTLADLNSDGLLDLYTMRGSSQTVTYLNEEADIFDWSRIYLGSQAGGLAAIEKTNTLLNKLTNELGTIGGMQSRLATTTSALRTSRDIHLEAASRIQDSDVAEDAALYVRYQILQQSSAAILAQANQLPRLMLDLLRG